MKPRCQHYQASQLVHLKDRRADLDQKIAQLEKEKNDPTILDLSHDGTAKRVA